MASDRPDWMSARTFHPELVITTPSPDVVVADLRRAFVAAGFRSVPSGDDAIRLRHHDWLAIASGMWARTDVVLSQREHQVLLQVTRGAEHRVARKKGQRALDNTVAALRAQDVEVTLGPWQRPT